MHIHRFIAGLILVLPLSAQSGGTGYIKTSVSPGRAGVFIDGKYVGPAKNFGISRTYAVAPGEHEVKLVDPRCKEVVTKVSVTAGKKTSVSQTLEQLPLLKPPFGTLKTVYPEKYAAVYLNGKYMGHADEMNHAGSGLLLPPGTYKLKIEPLSGGAGIEKDITIEAEKVTLVREK